MRLIFYADLGGLARDFARALGLILGLLVGLPGLAGLVTQPVQAASTRPASLDTPEGALWLFDSLLSSPTPDAAQPLTVGAARRMFEMIKLSSVKIKPFVDTVLSRDTVLATWQTGGRATVKMQGTVHFKQPFMGLDSLASVQAVQLVRLDGRWRIATLQELPDALAKADLPTVLDSTAWHAEQSPQATDALFPVSSRMVPPRIKVKEVRRMTLKVSLRHGPPGPLSHLKMQETNGPQSLLQTLGDKGDMAYTVLVKQPLWPPKGPPKVPPTGPPRIKKKDAQEAGDGAISSELQPYMASTAFLDLQDSALLQLSQALLQPHSRKPPARRQADYTRAVYHHLVTHFDYQLGATLFGTSRESLQRMRGDCSEGAMLTCALLRAQGIPSRLALGFASAGGGAFIGHAWCEAYFGDLNQPANGAWVGMDAALREFPAGAQRVRLALSDGQGDLRIMATNLVLGVLNNLDIEILSAESDKGKINLIDSPHDRESGRRFFEQVLDGVGR